MWKLVWGLWPVDFYQYFSPKACMFAPMCYLAAAPAVCVYTPAESPPTAPLFVAVLLSAALPAKVAAPPHGVTHTPQETQVTTLHKHTQLISDIQTCRGWWFIRMNPLTRCAEMYSSTCCFSSTLRVSVKPFWPIQRGARGGAFAARHFSRKQRTLRSSQRKGWFKQSAGQIQ